ncbi:AAA family ATPase [Fusobacterium sp.]|uniref:AAA family ATPase n=1 Tax=Fusobacterium sp. TaxID=68766 RepID=UPI002637EF40|nr:AAA family ATPase [Fusobacterium sp.]
MKPLFLSIEGLQSFQTKQEINFEKIGRDGLFGIFGPTGSGKSTIIDGMTLALYGNIIRFKTNKDSETKDFFDVEAINKNSDEARVNFKFKVGENIYRVERNYKIGKKSRKLTKSAVLFKIENGEEIKLAENYKDIYHEIKENILGLTLEDFTRSVVLPQGNFSQFLKLSGNEKRNMLERIFNLEKYGETLSKKANSYKYELENRLKELDVELNAIGFNEEEMENKEVELKALEIENKKLKEEEKKINFELSELEEIQKIEIKLSELNAQKLELDSRSEYINELEIKKNMAEKFIPIIEKIHKKNEYEGNMKSLLDEINEDNIKFESGKEMLSKEKEVYNSLENDENVLEKEKAENFVFQDEIFKVSDEYKNSLKIEEIKEKINSLEKDIVLLSSKKEDISLEINNIKTSLSELEKQKEDNKEISQDEIIEIEKNILEKENNIKTLEIKEKELNKVSSDKKDLEILLENKKIELLELQNLEKSYLVNRKIYFIYELEKELKDGDKCPLCNNTYHKNISKESVSFDENEFETLEKNIRTLKSEIQISEEKIKELEIKEKDILLEISLLPQAKSELEKLKSNKENLNKKYLEIKANLSNLEKEIKEKNSFLNSYEITLAKNESEINLKTISCTELKENLKNIVVPTLSTKELSEKLDILKEKSEKNIKIDSELSEIRKRKKDIFDKKITIWTEKIKVFETKLIQKKETYKNMTTEHLKLSSEINSVLLENKISDLKYISIIEKSIDNIESMKNEIEEYKNNRISVLNIILDYKEQLKNRSFSKEKFENLSERGKIVNMSLEKNTKIIGEVTKILEIFNINKKRAEKILKEKDELEIKLNPAKEMVGLLKGAKFLDFLSAGKLQSITRIASDTLQKITNGRYRINVDEKSDFSIIDNFNSAVRKPQSLSGGETFMVSLCLALALANQIQLKGKSRLEFFFLDEGFGTLDSELLEIVFGVLENLRADGMTVGIITHVEEIKNRVARRLMVYPAQIGISGTIVKEI